MRVVICAKNDLAANIAVNHLVAELPDCDLTFWLSDIDRQAELDDPDLASLRFFERQLPKRWIWPTMVFEPVTNAVRMPRGWSCRLSCCRAFPAE